MNIDTGKVTLWDTRNDRNPLRDYIISDFPGYTISSIDLSLRQDRLAVASNHDKFIRVAHPISEQVSLILPYFYEISIKLSIYFVCVLLNDSDLFLSLYILSLPTGSASMVMLLR